MDEEIREAFTEVKASLASIHRRLDDKQEHDIILAKSQADCRLDDERAHAVLQRQIDDARRGSGFISAIVSGAIVAVTETGRRIFG